MNKTHDFQSYLDRNIYTSIKDGPGYYDMNKVNFDILFKKNR